MAVALLQLASFIGVAQNAVGSFPSLKLFVVDWSVDLVGDASHDFDIPGATTASNRVGELLLKYLIVERLSVILFLRVRKEIQLEGFGLRDWLLGDILKTFPVLERVRLTRQALDLHLLYLLLGRLLVYFRR